MKQPGFLFGGKSDWTYDQLQRQRQIADALAVSGGTPKNVGEGLNAVGRALMSRGINKRADARDAELRGEFDKNWSGIFGGMGASGVATSAPATPPGPNQDIANETMTALGKRPDFGAVETQYNLPAGYLDRTFQIESGGNPNAQNPNSSAGGGFQFIDSTAKQYGLTDKTDLNASTDAAARLAVDNRQALRRVLGRDPTAAELYLAHQQGGGGAAKLLANPDARAVDIVGRDAVMLNGGNENMTAGQFAQKWTGKFGGQDRAAGQVAGGGSGMDLQALAEVAGSPYASPGQKAVAQSLLQQQMQANDPAAMLDLEYKKAQLDALKNPQPKQTSAMQEYELAKSQGFDGTFTDYKTAIAKAGASNTNIDMGQGEVGTIPQGYELFTDPETGARRLQPLPGGPEDSTKPDAIAAGNRETSTSTISNAAARAREAARSRQVGGLAGAVASYNPASQNAEVYRQVDVLKANAKVQNINAMRAASKTGAALGAASDRDMAMLGDMSGALDPKSPYFERDLDDFERTLLRVVHGPEAGDAIFEASRGPEKPSGPEYEAFSKDPTAQAAAQKYGVTIEEMWAIKQGLN